MSFDYTKDEVKYIKEKCYFSKEEEQILDLRLENNLTIDGIALEMKMSVSSVNRRIRRIRDKIDKIMKENK